MGIHSMFFHDNAQIQGILTLILVVLGIECKKGATYAHVLVILWASDRLIYSVMPKTVFFKWIKYNFWALEQEKIHLCPV